MPKLPLGKWFFIFLVKMFRSHFLCIGTGNSVSFESIENFVLNLVPLMYSWYRKLFMKDFYITYAYINKILFLWFIAFRQLFCQNKGIFVSKPVNYDNFLWKKPQHIIYCCKRNLEQNLNILILEHLIQEGDRFYALSA